MAIDQITRAAVGRRIEEPDEKTHKAVARALPGHGCDKTCHTNYGTLDWRDKLLVAEPLPGAAEPMRNGVDMPALNTPSECGDVAERVLVDYAHACGAHGGLTVLKNIMEMLIGIAMVVIEPTAPQIPDQTKRNVAAYAEANLRSAN
ncbi:hypothetical protein ACVCH0_20765 [Burkholderia glumae]